MALTSTSPPMETSSRQFGERTSQCQRRLASSNAMLPLVRRSSSSISLSIELFNYSHLKSYAAALKHRCLGHFLARFDLILFSMI